MAAALFLAGDRYHVADEAFAGVGPVLESAGLEVDYTTDFSSIAAQSIFSPRNFRNRSDGPSGAPCMKTSRSKLR